MRRNRGARARVEQPVQMNDEISRLRVVHCLLRLGLPRCIGSGVVWIDADDVELIHVLEHDIVETLEFAAEHEMKQLPRANLLRHVRSSAARRKVHANSRLRAWTRSSNARCRLRPAATRASCPGSAR